MHFSADELPLLDRCSQFAVLAAREALADAGLARKSAPIMLFLLQLLTPG
jgi:3-oxoacyl-(acyl-carrier-protein) synthase